MRTSGTTRSLVARSIEVIRAGQAPSGAYVASPTFENYRFAWFRDGSFVADAMSAVGERASAEAFFDWAARVIERHHPDLHARYTLDGDADETEWPKRQWDGYGLFLWAIGRHRARYGGNGWQAAAELTADWLAGRWREPCVDWWEERDGVHPATVACIWAGLAASGHPEAEAIEREYFSDLADLRMDASLLALLPPIGPCDPEPVLLELVEVGTASRGGGLYRYAGDEYYGGGEWLLLTALLGLVEAQQGRSGRRRARRRLEWVEAHATDDGLLPEQVQDHVQSPELYEEWVAKWGPPPCPLLWSHASYLALAHALGRI